MEATGTEKQVIAELKWREDKMRSSDWAAVRLAAKYRDGLLLCRKFIRGEMVEHAQVDLNRPNLGLGEHLDSILK